MTTDRVTLAGARVCMFVRNAFEFDARVEREARALADAGADVTVVALWDADRTARREMRGPVHVRRVSRWFWLVDKLRAAWVERANPDGTGPDVSANEDREQRDTVTRSLDSMQKQWSHVRKIGPIARARDIAIAVRMIVVGVQTKADVYHAHDLNTLSAASWCARIRRAKLVYDSHEIAPHQTNLGVPAEIEAKERGLIGRAHRVIHVTPMRADWAKRTYGIDRPTVLRNVPDVPDVLPAWDYLARAGFTPGSKIMLHAGGIQPDRGIEALVDAMPMLDESFVLAFVGYGRSQRDIQERVSKLGLDDRVRFTGAVPHEELLAATAASWCGFSLLVDTGPNHQWSLPNKLFESVGLGVPIIVSDNPEIARFVTEHGVGEVCDPKDAASIAAAVKRLDAHYDDVHSAARAVAAEYRWRTESTRLTSLYEDLLTR